MDAIEAAHAESALGLAPLCDALAISRSAIYRRRRPTQPRVRPTPARALSADERQVVLGTLHSDRFVDEAPESVVATLLEDGQYLCSARTMYRILGEQAEVRERRDQARHPPYTKPELMASRPNELWSWDITKLLGPTKWTYFYLYVILDVFSRYVVGWMIAHREASMLAGRLIKETIAKFEVDASKLIIHADRGPSMRSKHVAQLLADLGVTKTHSRPYTATDNPFSESQFKTMKYRPDFPARFVSIEEALAFGRSFFPWYNDAHRHSGIAMLTPADVYFGRAEAVLARRQLVLQNAYDAHPERFPHGCPKAPSLPKTVWINPPAEASSTEYNQPVKSEEVRQ